MIFNLWQEVGRKIYRFYNGCLRFRYFIPYLRYWSFNYFFLDFCFLLNYSARCFSLTQSLAYSMYGTCALTSCLNVRDLGLPPSWSKFGCEIPPKLVKYSCSGKLPKIFLRKGFHRKIKKFVSRKVRKFLNFFQMMKIVKEDFNGFISSKADSFGTLLFVRL